MTDPIKSPLSISLDEETERLMREVHAEFYARGVERCGCYEGSYKKVDALRQRIRTLIEEARYVGIRRSDFEDFSDD